MKTPTLLCGLFLAAAAGCATTREPAPAADHPASPRAAEAPAPKISATLKDAHADAAPPDAAAADPGAPEAFTCPHHPKVMQAEAGDCPYCGMPLVPTTSRQTSPVRGVTPAGGAASDHSAHERHEGHK